MKTYKIINFFLLFMFSFSFAYAESIQVSLIKKENPVTYYMDREEAIVIALQEAQGKGALDTAQPEKTAGETEFKDYKEIRERIYFLPAWLHPYLFFNTEYNDNIYLTDKNQVEDVIFSAMPGAKLNYYPMGIPGSRESEAEKLELDLGANIVSYLKNTGLNRQNPYVNLYTKMGRGIHKFNINNFYKRESSPTSSFTLGEQGLVDYQVNKSEVLYEAMFSHLSLELGYDREIFSFDDAPYKTTNNRLDQAFSISGALRLSSLPRTRFFLEYDYGMNSYPKATTDSGDSTYHKAWLGVKGRLFPKTQGQTKVGYEMRKYKDSSDVGSLTVNFQIEHDYSPLTRLLLELSRQIQDSTYRGDGYSESTVFSLKASRTFASNRRFSIFSGLDYSYDKYQSGRHDNSYGASTDLEYSFRKWLKFILGYKLKFRDSNSRDADYINNICTLTTMAVF